MPDPGSVLGRPGARLLLADPVADGLGVEPLAALVENRRERRLHLFQERRRRLFAELLDRRELLLDDGRRLGCDALPEFLVGHAPLLVERSPWRAFGKKRQGAGTGGGTFVLEVVLEPDLGSSQPRPHHQALEFRTHELTIGGDSHLAVLEPLTRRAIRLERRSGLRVGGNRGVFLTRVASNPLRRRPLSDVRQFVGEQPLPARLVRTELAGRKHDPAAHRVGACAYPARSRLIAEDAYVGEVAPQRTFERRADICREPVARSLHRGQSPRHSLRRRGHRRRLLGLDLLLLALRTGRAARGAAARRWR